ncbi:hypothetical protein AMS68_005699 [Peltaster fructicola]|uniref:Dethiobiotin synthase n=1 Tax=Peltaster fructicola TaxID=286661 RepID=A0A6H0XZI0_9PEZI|nr:hypothetical protein AMS68_005699 [Peltaster fructicola]
MRALGSALWPKLRVLQTCGANTGVGKTIFSTILCKAFQRRLPRVNYLKPVSTGPLDEADDSHISIFGEGVQARTLYQFQEPVSPHIAARLASTTVTDSELQFAVYDELAKYAEGGEGIAIVETAGGVLSPVPSGTTQADAYRPLRLPTFLVGDARLGGIGSTISAWESLHVRGYDVSAIALFEENRYENYRYLKDYFQERGVVTFAVQPPPEQNASLQEDRNAMKLYYDTTSSQQAVTQYVDRALQSHDDRIAQLRSMPQRTIDAVWHPFMQHRERSKEALTVMDSAYDDFFQTYSLSQEQNNESRSLLKPAFDGSASWWTQGLGHGNPHLALAAAHAAGRYGHVMFANAVHEPALMLAETLLQDMGNPKLSKVFYTDNGSTGMEVAVKMALRAASKRNGWQPEEDVEILGLTGSYHGDTIGTMDCSEPSIYNKKVEWYRGRGFWLDFPQIKMKDGRWMVEVPEQLKQLLRHDRTFSTLGEILDIDARKDDWQKYRSYFDGELQRLRNAGHKFGALVMEPVILGAGGMMFVDPLFQRCLIEAVRGSESHQQDWQGMPVIFDEVFTGLYRLGRFSAASFIGAQPDIVVNAKLLTGGVLPLCTTTASESIFEAFLSDDKSDALLHGHSYTAHAVGCTVANESLKTMAKLDQSETWSAFRADWSSESVQAASPWSMWSHDFVEQVSHKSNVEHVFAIGSVFAMSLKDPTGSGYASTAAVGLRDRLLSHDGANGVTVHSRVLGNILYLMASMTSRPETLKGVQDAVLDLLE